LPYRYEDLDPDTFQRMVLALLTFINPAMSSNPGGQSDGGYDAFIRDPATGDVVEAFQVKTTLGHEGLGIQSSRFVNAIQKEIEKNLPAMIGRGLREYTLITSVRGTSSPDKGRIDKLNNWLAEKSKVTGVAFSVWWRSDLDSRLDLAPDALKLSYPAMLDGAHALRAVAMNLFDDDRWASLTSIIKMAAATAWSNDSTTGFNQLDDVKDLQIGQIYIDVEAEGQGFVLGALERLVARRRPYDLLIEGGPGQGKSTLLRYLTQLHRAHLLGFQEYLKAEPLSPGIDSARLPFKVDLRDFGVWLSGSDPSSHQDPLPPRPPGSTDSVESFLAHMLTFWSGGLVLSVADFNDVLRRVPSLLVFDALDEVADPAIRGQVVDALQGFRSRLIAAGADHQILVSSRPGLKEWKTFDPARFEKLVLQPLSDELCLRFLDRWADAQKLREDDAVYLKSTYKLRTLEHHIRELVQSPMQLTILLSLIHQRGRAIPRRRTDLYSSYVDISLDRESKDATVMRYRDDLVDTVSFVAWHLQSRAEVEKDAGRIRTSSLRRAMSNYLDDLGKDTSLVTALVTGMTQRVWVLVSKTQGTFEFDVQTIREFFVALHLYESPPGRTPGRGQNFRIYRLLELSRRPYWANAARFMAGMFGKGDVYELAQVLEDTLADEPRRLWTHFMFLIYLSDGVFELAPRPQQRLASFMANDLSVRFALNAIRQSDLAPVSLDRGGDEIVSQLRLSLENDVEHSLAPVKAQLWVCYAGVDEVRSWWAARLVASADGVDRQHLLNLGLLLSPFEHVIELAEFLSEQPPANPSVLLFAGLSDIPGSSTERAMINSVICGDAFLGSPQGQSAAARLFLLATAELSSVPLQKSSDLVSSASASASVSTSPPDTDQALPIRGGFSIASLEVSANAPAFGWHGPTPYLINLATAIYSEFGKNWLSNYLVTRAAFDETQPDNWYEGPVTDDVATPLRLHQNLVRHGNSRRWWTRLRAMIRDDIDAMTWVVSLLSTKDERLVGKLLPDLIETVELLADNSLAIVVAALSWSRADANQWISESLVEDARAVSVATAALLAPLGRSDFIGLFTASDIEALNPGGVLTERILISWFEIATARAGITSEIVNAMNRHGPHIGLREISPTINVTSDAIDAVQVDRTPWPLLEHVYKSSMGPLGDLSSVASNEEWFLDRHQDLDM
jgi:hypothetical protein